MVLSKSYILRYVILQTVGLKLLQAAEFVCHDHPVNLGISFLWNHQSLMCNEFLVSDDGNAVAHMHPDGDVRFYDRAGNEYYRSPMSYGYGTLLLIYYGAKVKIANYNFTLYKDVDFGDVLADGDLCGRGKLLFSAFDHPIPAVYRNQLFQELCLMTVEKLALIQTLTFHWYYDGQCFVTTPKTAINKHDAENECSAGMSIFASTNVKGHLSSKWSSQKHAYVMPKITGMRDAFPTKYISQRSNGWTSANRKSVQSTPEEGWTWEDGSSPALFESTNMSKPLNACAIIRTRTGGLVETPCDSVDAFAICEYDMLEYYCWLATNVTTRPMNTQLRFKGTPRREFTELVVEETNGVCEQMCQLRCTSRRDCGSLTFIPPATCRLHRVHNDTEGLCFHTIPHANAIYYTIAG